jgi:hypothetical protein
VWLFSPHFYVLPYCHSPYLNTRAQLVARLQLELDSGGNIRLEDGRTAAGAATGGTDMDGGSGNGNGNGSGGGDVWVASCIDLLHSRFQPTDVGYASLVVAVAAAAKAYARAAASASVPRSPPLSARSHLSPSLSSSKSGHAGHSKRALMSPSSSSSSSSLSSSSYSLPAAPIYSMPLPIGWVAPGAPLTGMSGALGASEAAASLHTITPSSASASATDAGGASSAVAAGPLGLRILRVTRVHNRGLRARFEEQLESVFTQQAVANMPKIDVCVRFWSEIWGRVWSNHIPRHELSHHRHGRKSFVSTNARRKQNFGSSLWAGDIFTVFFQENAGRPCFLGASLQVVLDLFTWHSDPLLKSSLARAARLISRSRR